LAKVKQIIIEYVFKVTCTNYRHKKVKSLIKQAEDLLIAKHKHLHVTIEYYEKYIPPKTRFNRRYKNYKKKDLQI